MKSGKRSMQKKVVSTFYEDARQTSIFAFAPENARLFRENQYNYIFFDFLNPPFHYPRAHDSAKKLHFVPNIPGFQHSKWARPLTCVPNPPTP